MASYGIHRVEHSGFTAKQLKVTYNTCHLQRAKTIHFLLLLFPQHGAILYPVTLQFWDSASPGSDSDFPLSIKTSF